MSNHDKINCEAMVDNLVLSLNIEHLKKILNHIVRQVNRHDQVLESKIPEMESLQAQLESSIRRLDVSHSFATSMKVKDSESGAIVRRLEKDCEWMQLLYDQRGQAVITDLGQSQEKGNNLKSVDDKTHAILREVIVLKSLIQQLQQEHDNDIMGSLETRHQVEDIRLDLVQLHGKAAECISTIQASELQESVRRYRHECQNQIKELEDSLGSEIKQRLQGNETKWRTWLHQHEVKDNQWHDVIRGQLRLYAKASEVVTIKASCEIDIHNIGLRVSSANDKVECIILDLQRLKRRQAFATFQRQFNTWRRKMLIRGLDFWKRYKELMQKQEIMIKAKRRIVRLFAGRQALGYLRWGFYRWHQCTEHLRNREEQQLKSAKVIFQRMYNNYLLPQQFSFGKWKVFVATAALDEMYKIPPKDILIDLPNDAGASSMRREHEESDDVIVKDAISRGRSSISSVKSSASFSDKVQNSGAGSLYSRPFDGTNTTCQFTTKVHQPSMLKSTSRPNSSGSTSRYKNITSTTPSLPDLKSGSDLLIDKKEATEELNAGSLQKVIRGLGKDTKGSIDVLARELDRIKLVDMVKLRKESSDEYQLGVSYVLQKLDTSTKTFNEALHAMKIQLTENWDSASKSFGQISESVKIQDVDNISKFREVYETLKQKYEPLYVQQEEITEKTYDLEIALSQTRNRVAALDTELGKSTDSTAVLMKRIEMLEMKHRHTEESLIAQINTLKTDLGKAGDAIVVVESRCEKLENLLAKTSESLDSMSLDSKNQFQTIHAVLNTPGVRKPPYHRLIGECLVFEKDSHERKFVVGFNSMKEHDARNASGKSTSIASAIAAFAQDYASWIAYQADHEAVMREICCANPDELEYNSDEVVGRRKILLDVLRKEMGAMLEEAHACPGALRLEARTKFIAKLVEATDTALTKHDRAMNSLNTRLGKKNLLNSSEAIVCMGCDRPLRSRGEASRRDESVASQGERVSSAMERTLLKGDAISPKSKPTSPRGKRDGVKARSGGFRTFQPNL